MLMIMAMFTQVTVRFSCQKPAIAIWIIIFYSFSSTLCSQEIWSEKKDRISWTDSKYSPEHELQSSALAIDNNLLYISCENFPVLLRYNLSTSKLDSVINLNLKTNIDVEGCSLYGDTLYLIDEDLLQIYAVELKTYSMTKIDASGLGIDRSAHKKTSSDFKSIEGLIVSPINLIPSKLKHSNSKGPYFYLLDESDKKNNNRTTSYEAVLYVATLHGKKLKRVCEPIRFKLSKNERLPDLALVDSTLYGLKSEFHGDTSNKNKYQIVRLDMTSKKLETVFDFTKHAYKFHKTLGSTPNFEGMAFDNEGNLFVVSDNRMGTSTLGNKVKEKTILLKFRSSLNKRK